MSIIVCHLVMCKHSITTCLLSLFTVDLPFTLESWSLPLMWLTVDLYCYMWELLQLQAMTPISAPLLLPCYHTPLHIEVVMSSLKSHLDAEFVAFILKGYVSISTLGIVGFCIGYCGQSHQLRSVGQNHPSSVANPAAVQSHICIQSELTTGRLVHTLTANMLMSALLGWYQRVTPLGNWRMIADLSSPTACRVNDEISALCS